MTPADQKKLFRAFAKQLENGHPPTEEQTEYLIHVFRGIGTGRDPTRILGLRYDDGKSNQDEAARIHMDFVMHWIACATEAVIDEDGNPIKPFSMDQAFKEGSKMMRKLSGITGTVSYDPIYIKKVWYERKKQGKVSTLRSASDPDSIYEYTAPDSK